MNWPLERPPDAAVSAQGGRSPRDNAEVLRGIFRILDNCAKWKELPREFGSRAKVHRWFQHGTRGGLFETAMRAAGRLLEECGGYRLYECFITPARVPDRGVRRTITFCARND